MAPRVDSRHNNKNGVLMSLVYHEINMDQNGNVLSRDQIKEERFKRGYCLECTGVPVQLYRTTRNRLVPVFQTKVPMSDPGRCHAGKCLVCHPELDPNPRRRKNGLGRRQHGPRSRNVHSSKGMHGPNSPSGAHGQQQHHHQNNHHHQGNSHPNNHHHQSNSHLSNHHNNQSNSHLTNHHHHQEVAPPVPPLHADVVVVDPPASPKQPLPDYRRDQRLQRHTPRGGRRLHDDEGGAPPPPRLGQSTSNSNVSTSLASRPRRPQFQPPAPLQGPVLDRPEPPPRNHSQNTSNLVGFQIEFDNKSSSSASTDISDVDRVEEVIFNNYERASRRRLVRESSVANLSAGRRQSLPSIPAQPREVTVESSGRPPEPPQESTPVDHDKILANLESLLKDVSGAADASSDFATDLVVHQMRSYPNVLEVQVFCISQLWDQARLGDKFRASIVSSTAPDDILAAMRNFISSWRLQEVACGTLWGLSTKQEHRPILAKAGAAPRVVRALVQHMEVEDVVLRALGTLRTLSSEMEVRQDLVALEAPQQVAKAMKLHRNNPAVQRDGCAFLSNSAVDVERQQVALATEGEVEAIIKAMAAHKNDPSVLTGATFALKNYSFMDRNVRTISACENAVSLLEYTMNNCTDSNGRDDAVVVLERIQTCFADDENLEDTVYQSMMDQVHANPHAGDSVKQVLNTMNDYDWSTTVVAGGFEALRSLVSRSPTHRAKLGGNQLKSLVGVLARHDASVPVQIEGCNLLADMAVEMKCRYSIMDGDGWLIIVKAMRKHMDNVDVQVAATSALRALSKEFDCWFELEKSGNVGIVRQSMGAHPRSPQLQENGADILSNFSTYAGLGIPT